jgi:conjugative relaxase-like TrwC/TraI family protein
VLTIGKLGASPDQLEYYERQVAAGIEDYYAARGEAPGRWIGAGCGGLGAGGRVEHDAFMALMRGRDPIDGSVLRRMGACSTVAAVDLTLSAPKSVSVLFAIADDHVAAALLDAHERALDAALGYLEREACWTRRGHGGAERMRGDGFIAAAYRHRLSRAGDPQLHTHVVVANLTQADGRWTALDAHVLYEHKSAAGALYRAVLRAEVRERLPWVSWQAAGRGLFEIEGVPDRVLREFSRRRVEIEQRARELTGVGASGLSRERLQGIVLATRRGKEYGVDGARWREEARARAAEHGFGRHELRRLGGVRPSRIARSEADIVRVLVERLSGPGGLTTNHNTFATRHVLAEVAGALDQGATVAQLQRVTDAYLGDGSVVSLGHNGGKRRYTTRDLLACEQAIVEGAVRRGGTSVAVLGPAATSLALPRLEVELSAEQQAAVLAVAGGGNGVEVMPALAGTGKTRVLGALAGCYRQAGYRIVGVAPTGRAARELGNAIGAPAVTLHALLSDLDRSGGFKPKMVILFDEAGMAQTRQTATLLGHAERAGAKVIAAGDAGQLPSVQAGGWFAAVTRQLGGVHLRGVLRQRDRDERAALEALHDGDPDAYLAFKQQQHALRVHAGEQDALATLVREWNQARTEHGLTGSVMIARDNATRALLNQEARATLKRDGTVALDGVIVTGREFCVGERVIARRNDRYRDIDNGTRATITAINRLTGALTVKPDSGGRRVLDTAYVADHLEYAYALTGHGAQGATVEWAGIIGHPCEFTAEWAYTALSRARTHTRLHVMAEPSSARREREHYAPPEPTPTLARALDATRAAMKRREAEQLAVEHAEPQELPTTVSPATLRLPLAELVEAGAERAHSVATARRPDRRLIRPPPPEPDWRGLQRARESMTRGPSIHR